MRAPWPCTRPAASPENDAVFGYAIDRTTGALAFVDVEVLAQSDVSALGFDPSGRFLYAAHENADQVTRLAIDGAIGGNTEGQRATGQSLSRRFIQASGSSSRIIDVAPHPGGRFVYVSGWNDANHRVLGRPRHGRPHAVPDDRARREPDQWARDRPDGPTARTSPARARTVGCGSCASTRSRALMTPTTVTAGAAGFAISESVAVDPTGRFLFVAWELEDVVDVYAIEPVTGGLTLVESQFSGNAPAQVVVDPLGRFVYVVNLNPSGVDTVAGFRLAGNGALTPVSTLSHTSAARGAVVDPPGRFLVVGFSAGPSPVHVYAIDPGTGALSFVMSNGGVPPASAVAIGRHGAVRLRRARRERGDREVDAGPGRRRADHGTRTPHER